MYIRGHLIWLCKMLQRTLWLAPFQAGTEILLIRTMFMPIKASSMNNDERYYSAIRRTYTITLIECSWTDREELFLKDVTETSGAVKNHEFVLPLFVFRTLSRFGLPTDNFPKSFRRAAVVCNATAAVSEYSAKRHTRRALHTINEPNVMDIRKRPITSLLLVYRPMHVKKKRSRFNFLFERTRTICFPDWRSSENLQYSCYSFVAYFFDNKNQTES